ncbi:MAG: hypothetical protein RQ751_02285 [Longimicrobiales bacterium]|nr:hypothetical protein [Longimicrobiales bacterium]
MPDPDGDPAVLLYVTETCPHCRRELASWEARVESGRAPRPWILAAPTEGGDRRWIPAVLRGRAVLDTGGHSARALDVRAVPLTLFTDSARVVRAVVLGRSSPSAYERGLQAAGFPPPSEDPS